jgi:hypothetical protein
MMAQNHRLSLFVQLVFLLLMASIAVGDVLDNYDPDKDYSAEDYGLACILPAGPSIDREIRIYDGLQPRITFDSSRVYAYPSLGGEISARVTAVELSWLGLSVSSANESMIDDTVQEDAFALRLLQIGGKWLPNKRFSRDTSGFFFELDYRYREPRRPDLDVGYLADGGILLLQTLPGRPYERSWHHADDELEPMPEKPRDYSRLELCTTMEERCSVLRNFGATLYPSIENCTDGTLPRTLEEGIAQGKNHTDRIMEINDDFWMPKHREHNEEEPTEVVRRSMWSSIIEFAGMGRAR